MIDSNFLSKPLREKTKIHKILCLTDPKRRFPPELKLNSEAQPTTESLLMQH